MRFFSHDRTKIDVVWKSLAPNASIDLSHVVQISGYPRLEMLRHLFKRLSIIKSTFDTQNKNSLEMVSDHVLENRQVKMPPKDCLGRTFKLYSLIRNPNASPICED